MDIEIRERQIQGEEQEVVLSALAASAARQGCLFLEIGSWCGDTALILGRAAKALGGKLVCIDWWKGSPGTELFEVAKKKDVYSFFWRRVCGAGLEDTVISIRARSEETAGLFKRNDFDLVFIDGDHRYGQVSMDIEKYSPLVKRDGGILCGHDCDGRISDFDPEFLDEGRDENFHESIHCGVVLAVGRAFEDYSIDYNIWSVRAKDGGWAPADIEYQLQKGQFAPPPIGVAGNYNITRYGKFVYAIPRSRGNAAVTEDILRKMPDAVRAKTLNELLKTIGTEISPCFSPVLWDSYKGFNLIRYGDRFFAMSQALGNIDITSVSESELNKYKGLGLCAEAKDPIGTKNIVDGLSHLFPELVEEGYRGFNIIAYKRMFYAFSQELGPTDLRAVEKQRLKELIKTSKCVIAKTHQSAKELIDLLSARQARKELMTLNQKVKALEKEVSERDFKVKSLEKEMAALKAARG